MEDKSRKTRNLKGNSHLLTEILEGISDGILVLDPHWTIIYLNQRAAANLGSKPQDLIGRNIWEKFPQMSGTPHEVFYRKTLTEQEIQHFESRGVLAGQQFYITVYPISEGIAVHWRDITTGKKAEEDLRESEELRKTILENSSYPLVVRDSNEKLIYVNPAFEKLTGFSASEVIGMTFPAPWWPEKESLGVYAEHRRKAKRSWETIEAPLKKKNGEIIWTEVNSGPVLKDGQLEYWIANWVDITDRKKAEEIFRYQALLVESVSDAVISTDLNFNIVSWNKAAEKIYGWQKSEVIGKSMQEITQTKFFDGEREESVVELKERGFWQGEVIQTKKSGIPINIQAYVSLIRDASGKPIGIVACNRDITERKSAEDSLVQSEVRLERSQEIAHLGSWELDLINNRLSWSDEVYRIFGLQPQEFGATYEAFLEAIHPDDRAAVDAAYSSSVKEMRDTYEIEHRVTRRSTGEIRYVHEKCQHVRDETGKIIRSVGMVHDITERHLAEEALAKAMNELEMKVQERTLKLKESEEKYRSLVENASEAVVVTQDERHKFFNSKALELWGCSREEFLARRFIEFTYIDDRNLVMERHKKRLKGENVPTSYEHRIIYRDGGIKWVSLNAVLISWEGKPATLSLLTDITKSKNLEQALKEYAKRITQVQEEERKRIAYELHDDTAQYLSILKLQLDSIINSGKIQSPEILEKLKYLERDAGRAVDDVRRYSHELRPGVLEHLGLVAALEQIADDINKLKQIEVELKVEGSEPEMSEEIKLGFFRIAQEALNNCRKHAKACKAVINLKFQENRIEMVVRDNGAGFDVTEAVTRSSLKGSLGLMSMQERAKLIGANLRIESAPGKGTTIILQMPFVT